MPSRKRLAVAVLAAESIWVGVRPWQAAGSVVTVTWSLMAVTPNRSRARGSAASRG